ncbi:hypothetical protein M758_12G111800 [Ceratodon purpureus]|uniref:Uncharacterized protein n=1 Tax=Ceratodon purpureus TaxID=3225 RepID=A0A8T0G9W2_CERPU|nr:hypothetical protein KC19_12G107900 [Ceratodon purpureus]KAG0598918.1 hypothetical protein M758_12G111800 [Ceratodon purpureus]
MQERGQPVMSIRLIISVLIGLFVISFGGLLLQYGGVFVQTYTEEEVAGNLIFDGVVLSMKDERFEHTRNVLTFLGIKVVQKVPPSFQSKEVDKGLELYVGSRGFHTSAFLKVWSNRMAFIDALEEFVQDSSCNAETWRFFFEDDIAIHPNITSARARVLLAKGVKLADKDGFMYLGICGPNCTEARLIDNGVQAARCAGTCAHAFGFQRWKAAEFLTEMSGLTLKGVEGPVILGFYFDRYMYEYANQVQKIWVVGSNLKSPVQSVVDHFGLLFQDRAMYPTTITK